MSRIAVIDTETNWHDEVMSIGVAVADGTNYELVDTYYYVLTPEVKVGGMFSGALRLSHPHKNMVTSRQEAMDHLVLFLTGHGVDSIYAYNARFDWSHMPELRRFSWYDIMRLAAYRQFNPAITADMECCRTGKLKRGYGVEPILRMLSGDYGFRETHNGLYDALDELEIMKLLGHPTEDYSCAKI